MSSYDKVVKLACKPKAAPPKAKYLDPIIAATWSDDGAVHDVCKALSPRFREPNAIVVFKALIVLHTMIRNGATDNVLGYLSSSEVLRLRNVSAGNWEGYAAPENLQNYARYLDSRIRAYHDLKHDAVRVQAESNRDMRNSQSIEDDSHRSRPAKSAAPAPTSSGPSRSKTIMGRKLRVMTVEKGLLRETKAVHGMIDALVECRFYLDDLEDELTITALRMLVKDLLILFQAGNEGVINVLEHYFEMSHVDAEEALAIYRHFCKQTERVVEFLGVAKKLQNLLNVPIPNLKHAPVSLAGALQEYLDDPSFEQNRIEYKANKEAADRGNKKPLLTSKSKTMEKSAISDKPSTPGQPSPSTASTSTLTSTPPKPAPNKDVIDFFSTIEEEQPTMFNPQTNSPNTAYFHHQGTSNPFAQMQMTGQPSMHAQPTGFLQPQHTAFQLPPTNPFGLAPQTHQQAGHRPFSTFLPQATGVAQPQQHQQSNFLQPQQSGFLQPQATGANPFRQSMLFPQSTGMALFTGGGAPVPSQMNMNSFPNQNSAPHGQAPSTFTPFPSTGIAFSATTSVASPFSQPPSSGTAQPSNLPARPSSTPLTSFGSSSTVASPPVAQPVKTHQTGTKNPFGPITVAPPPIPRQPTLMELAMGSGTNDAQSSQPPQNQQQQPQFQQPQQTGLGSFNFNTGALSPGATDISSVASSFAFNKPNGAATSPQYSSIPSMGALNTQTASTSSGSTFSDSAFSSSLSSQPTGATNSSSAPSSVPSGAIKPQLTGFAGLKPFKPSSSFGASLLESLPPIPASSPTTPSGTAATNGTTTNTGGGPTWGASSTSPFGATGTFGAGRSTLGQGLRPQMTGGAANPFRASMMGSSNFPATNQPAQPLPGFPSSSTAPSFGGNVFGGSSGSFGPGTIPGQPQQPQNGSLL
ncbi:ENTH domain-containing protein C19F8.03c [Hypsizygus marmoreus]|uniref:ENTH domain-containing protein C19F8.03c n=1 Tax=Hypsizygus marmoreus TaxID=39966 RepID=A0A369JMW7_HYPMA|nr:ENTH domain-containing protein C19F8.03c [Hypsizygus marmoreus]